MDSWVGSSTPLHTNWGSGKSAVSCLVGQRHSLGCLSVSLHFCNSNGLPWHQYFFNASLLNHSGNSICLSGTFFRQTVYRIVLGLSFSEIFQNSDLDQGNGSSGYLEWSRSGTTLKRAAFVPLPMSFVSPVTKLKICRSLCDTCWTMSWSHLPYLVMLRKVRWSCSGSTSRIESTPKI